MRGAEAPTQLRRGAHSAWPPGRQKAELIAVAKPFYFTHHHGQHAVASSVEARSADGKVVRVGISNSYRGTSDEPAITRLAGEHAARYFKQSFELKIKGDVIPEAAVEPLLAELQELFARHGASAALSAKATIKPTKEFASGLRRCPAGCAARKLSRSARFTLRATRCSPRSRITSWTKWCQSARA